MDTSEEPRPGSAATSDFVALYERLRPRLQAYAFRLTRNHADAEDAVQDAALALLSRDGVACDRPSSYLYRVVRNVAVTGIRRRSRETPLVGEPLWPEPDASSDAGEALDLDALVRLAGGDPRLPTIWLGIAAGRTYRQIAAELGCSADSIKALVWRARKRLSPFAPGRRAAARPARQRVVGGRSVLVDVVLGRRCVFVRPAGPDAPKSETEGSVSFVFTADDASQSGKTR